MTKLLALTSEQEKQLAIYREDGLRVGLQAGNSLPSKERLLELFSDVYTTSGLPAPTNIVILDNPLHGCIGSYILGQVREQVRGQVREQVRGPVGEQVRGQVGEQVRGQVWEQVRGQVWEQVRGQVGEQVWDQVRDQVWGPVWDQIYKCGYGLHDTSWLWFYKYFLEQGNIQECARLIPLIKLARNGIGWWWPFTDIVIVTPQPTQLHMRNGRLHSSQGPAIQYEGMEVYTLNGVRFSGDMIRYITTPTNQLHPQDILSITNVEQRAEMIKLYGIEKLLNQLKTRVIHISGGYQLIQVDLEAYSPRVYLRMENPSVNETHIESVHPDCRTVEAALNWRNFGKVSDLFQQPLILT